MRTSSNADVYFVADHLASVRALTAGNGSVSLRREYDPFGTMDSTSSAVSGPAFTGREWDSETGLYHLRARYYSSDVGRFVSNDPIGFEGGVNLYKYSDANPTSVVDPSGLGPIKIITLCAKGYQVVKTVGFKQAVQAVLRGEDVLASLPKRPREFLKPRAEPRIQCVKHSISRDICDISIRSRAQGLMYSTRLRQR